MPSKAFRLAEAMVSNPIMSDMVENPTATPTKIATVETKTASISNTGAISAKNITTNNTLTQSFDSNQIVDFNLTDSINSVSPIVSVFKEVPQSAASTKGNWDVNSNATNYEFFDEKPISYSSAILTPSATGDGTFTNSAASVTYYDVANATYDNVSNATYGGQLNGAMSTIFNNNGTKAYVTATYNNGSIFQYSLSTAYDVSTNTYDSKTYSFSEFTYPTASRFNGDGTKLYTVAWNAAQSSSRIYQYSLSTPYDISTASYDSVNLDLTAHRFVWGFTFNNDGSKVFVSIVENNLSNSGRVGEYSLSTNYDLSTAGSQTLHILSGTGWYNYGIEFNNDGTKLFVNNNDDVPTKGPHVFTLSTAYDISTTSYTSTSADVVTLFGSSMGASDITFNNNGSKMYISDNANGYVRQFSVSTSIAFNTTDVGKKVVGNSGSAIITSVNGGYTSITAFADTSAISSWTLTGAQGKADGSGIELSGYSVQSDIVFPTGASGAGATMAYNNNVTPTTGALSNVRSVAFNSAGTIALVLGNGKLQRWNLTTAFDLSTFTEDTSDNFSVELGQDDRGLQAKPDGTRVWISNYSSDTIKQFTLSTPWSPSTQTYNGYYRFNNGGKWNSNSGSDGVPSTTNFNPFDFQFNSDGTKLITLFWDNVPYHSVAEFALSTGWDMSTMSYTSYANLDNSVDPEAMAISPDGLKLMVHGYDLGNTGVEVYSLPSAFSVGSAGSSLTKTSGAMDISTLIGDNSAVITYGGLSMSNDGKRLWVTTTTSERIWEITGGTTSLHPYSQYIPTITGSTGQINSSTWIDINSMTADETKNGGDVFYAVSVDSRTSWGVAKGSNGVRKIVKNNGGTWQYNNNAGTSVSVGFGLSSPSYDSKSYTVPHSNPRGMYLKSDGTELYIGAYTGHVYQYTLSTPNDISTASSTGNYNIGEVYDTVALTFKPDGTKMYATGGSVVYQYTLSTAWDITTASYDSVSYDPSDMGSSDIHSLNFNSDGTKLFMSDDNSSNKRIREYSLSTPYVVSSASTTSNYLYHNKTNVRGVDFNSDGTKIFLSSYSTQFVYQYNLASAYTLSSSQGSTADVEYDASSTISSNLYSIAFSNDGTKLFILEDNTPSVKQFSTTSTTTGYGTGETWVNGTTNNEHATLQEALTAKSFNRMNKAQLDAVADDYHFSQDSANTLDLMIAPYAASGQSPISDGVTINYNAAVIVREAVAGTDYVAEFPSTNKIKIKSFIDGNMKIRAQ